MKNIFTFVASMNKHIMFKKLFCFLFIFGLVLIKLNAQDTILYSEPNTSDVFSVIQDNSFGGNITLYQNPSLQVLIDKNIRLNQKNGLKGYRIQIYSGSGNTAREEANNASQTFKNTFPKLNSNHTYLNYKAPYFKVRIGDFRNKNEAFEFYHMIKNKFPGSYIVKTRINFPKLIGHL